MQREKLLLFLMFRSSPRTLDVCECEISDGVEKRITYRVFHQVYHLLVHSVKRIFHVFSFPITFVSAAAERLRLALYCCIG